jgi:PAS domain S-box-containing protein
VDQPTFRVLAETTPAAIFVQRDGRLLYVNAAAEAISGYSRGELLSLDVWQLLPPDVRERARAVYAARLRGEPVSVPPRREQRLIARNGETRWLDVSIGRIEWGGAPALLGTAFDVSDRRRAEAAHRRDEQRYRALIEHASDAVLVFDATRLVTYVGPSLERILGHQPSALEGHDLYELVHPDDLELCRSAVETRCWRARATPCASSIGSVTPTAAGAGWRHHNLMDDRRPPPSSPGPRPSPSCRSR